MGSTSTARKSTGWFWGRGQSEAQHSCREPVLPALALDWPAVHRADGGGIWGRGRGGTNRLGAWRADRGGGPGDEFRAPSNPPVHALLSQREQSRHHPPAGGAQPPGAGSAATLPAVGPPPERALDGPGAHRRQLAAPRVPHGPVG